MVMRTLVKWIIVTEIMMIWIRIMEMMVLGIMMMMEMIRKEKKQLTSTCSSLSLLTITGRTKTSVKSAWS